MEDFLKRNEEVKERSLSEIEQITSGLNNALDNRQDYFLLNPPKQPKKEIADYVEKEGILVPKRFNTLSAALEFINQGGRIMIRSEHPDEYNGASGLLESYELNETIIEKAKVKTGGSININRREFWLNVPRNINKYDPFFSEYLEEIKNVEEKIFAQIDSLSQEELENNLKKLSKKSIQHYCKLLKIDTEEFLDSITYSYREKLEYNGSVIADTAIEKRYHVFMNKDTNNKDNYRYFIIENGKILNNSFGNSEEIDKIITFYEKVRKLEKFNPQHCPIIEFGQGNDTDIQFLQYHRTRDKELSEFVLDRSLEEGEIEAEYVRGSTSPEGIIVKAIFYRDGNTEIKESEEAAIDDRLRLDDIFEEIMSRKRIVNILKIPYSEITKTTYNTHLSKSKQFNPKITVSVPTLSIPGNIYHKAMLDGEDAEILVRIISDGRKAYVKILDTDPQ